MKVQDYDKYICKDINKDTQLTPVRPGAVEAYLGKMGKSVDDHVKFIKSSREQVLQICETGM